jgi:TonB dependent receptor/TonB-dependent Receptor Plug Domain
MSLSIYRPILAPLCAGFSLTTLTAVAVLAQAETTAEAVVGLEPVVVTGRALALLTQASTSSEGQVSASELALRPFLRRGELLEVVPGLVVTQHSGSGKANQYFLRGFNLDHGTDFALTVDCMPVNARSHAHGQGYTDVNFVIPEMIDCIAYQKGTFSAVNGDFSAAGAAQFHLMDELPSGFAKLEFGEDNYARAVLAQSFPVAQADHPRTTTVAVETAYADGPWEKPEASRRLNAFARHYWRSPVAQSSLTALAYDGRWSSTDQIPLAAIDRGEVGRFATLDPSDGGDSRRFSLSYDRSGARAEGTDQLNVYALSSALDLYSNFTYFANDPVNGDQFNQREDRIQCGASFARTREFDWADRPLSTTFGVQGRDDLIDVALRHTAQRELIAVTRQDEVHESSIGLFARGIYSVAPWCRIETGARGDFYRFEVKGGDPVNSGTETAGIFSPKAGLVFGPWAQTELYANAGLGFHSNDARGVTDPVDPATPLVQAKNAELGLRTAALPGLVSTISVWALELDSELVFVGDEGTTEAGAPSRRHGIEFANYYQAAPWLALDADLAFTQARFRDVPSGQAYIPNSVDRVLTAGAALDLPGGWSSSLRVRYFGSQPLIEDNSVRAPSTLTYNARFGWRGGGWELALDVLNLFDRTNNDIAYYSDGYRTTPTGPLETGLVLHPAEPRTVRLSATRRF